MAEDSQIVPVPPPAPPRPKRRISEKKFVDAIIVRTDDGQRFKVPRTAEAARARTQILAARITELFEKKVKTWTDSNIPLPPSEIKELAMAAKKVQELSEAAYTGAPPPSGGFGAETGLGKLLQGAVMAGAAATQAGVTLADEMRKLTDIGKKADVEARRAGKEIIVEEVK